MSILIDGSLIISQVKPEDAGKYTCSPSNSLGRPPSASAYLTVHCESVCWYTTRETKSLSFIWKHLSFSDALKNSHCIAQCRCWTTAAVCRRETTRIESIWYFYFLWKYPADYTGELKNLKSFCFVECDDLVCCPAWFKIDPKHLVLLKLRTSDLLCTRSVTQMCLYLISDLVIIMK